MRPWEERLLAKDLVRALLVLALVCLNFVHHGSVSVAYSSELRPYVLTGGALTVLCAGDPDGDGGSHAPCHACRIGFGLDLPPAPTCADPLHRTLAPVIYAPALPDLRAARLQAAFHARGPPAA